MFRIVKRYYERKIYDNADVARFVKAGQITKEDYQNITGEIYEDAETTGAPASAE